MDMEKLLHSIITPLVGEENFSINKLENEEGNYQVLLTDKAFGLVIGRAGKNARAIRTICIAVAAKNNSKVRIQFDKE